MAGNDKGKGNDNDKDLHLECVNRFVALANTMKDEGIDIKLVNAALMTSSGLYTSYMAGGNEGGLTESGVERVTELYRRELARIQAFKKQSDGE